MPLTDPGIAGWMLIVGVMLVIAWLLVYYTSRSATRGVIGQISNVEVTAAADGRTLLLKNTGALALANIVVDRHPPQAGKAGHLWTVPSLAVGAVVTAHVPATTAELPASVLLSWRVGSPTGPTLSAIRPLVREE
jgi:hypothetical protein